MYSNSVVPKVVARSHLADSSTVEWSVILSMRDASPPLPWPSPSKLRLGKHSVGWGGLLLLGRLQLHLVLSMRHKSFTEARQPVPVKKNWCRLPQRVSLLQRAVEVNFSKICDSKTSLMLF